MKSLNLKEIKDAVSGEIISGNPEKIIEGVSTDTRTMVPGDLFIALIGKNFDGHNFVTEAIEKNASAVISDRKLEIPDSVGEIVVNDTTAALQDLAKYYRNLLKDTNIIGITGSVGKTTTKDIVSNILSQKYKVNYTKGNLNNHIGVPLTLLNFDGNEDFGVLELGMNKKGEIKLLSDIISPQIGIITSVGPAHLKYLDNINNVAKEKSSLISKLTPEGIALLNYDNKYVRNMSEFFSGENIIYFGRSSQADIYADEVEVHKNNSISFKVNFRNEKFKIKFKKPGVHNIYNILPGIAIARVKKVKWEEIQKGLNTLTFSSLRMDIKEINNILIINDTYNANPMSMKAALDTLDNIAKKGKIAVLGDMLELGKRSKKEHLNIGKYVVKKDIDKLITVGQEAQNIAEGAIKKGMDEKKVFITKKNKTAGEILLNNINKDDSILIKGSRAMKMEKIMDMII